MNHIGEARLGEDRSILITFEGRKLRLRRDDVHEVLHGNQVAAQAWEVPVVPVNQTRLAVTA